VAAALAEPPRRPAHLLADLLQSVAGRVDPWQLGRLDRRLLAGWRHLERLLPLVSLPRAGS
jgi:hypothetical protein